MREIIKRAGTGLWNYVKTTAGVLSFVFFMGIFAMGVGLLGSYTAEWILPIDSEHKDAIKTGFFIFYIYTVGYIIVKNSD